MKKIDKIIKKVKEFFSYKKENRKLKVYVIELEKQVNEYEILCDNLKFEIDRDDNLQRIKYLEKRVEELHIQKRELREELKESKKGGKKNEWKYSKIHRKT